MKSFLEIDSVDRVFPLPGGGQYVALKNINVDIKAGEFISLLGHSGCGKSTLLNIVAGLDRPTTGGIVLEGREVRQPGPDRMVVFQNYSLLPWLTVRENVALGVDEVMQNLPAAERQEIVDHHIKMVRLQHAADKKPDELSGGMKQRVAIARALALRPKLLLLDEPFGALDALTRGGLQEQLMQICQEYKVTCLMVTHDADEALLLSDRIVMLTNGPAAHVGQILEVPFPRPRHRMDVVNHPRYYALRSEIVYFLEQQKKDKKRQAAVQATAVVSGNGLEKVNLEIGFIPLTDCAPLAVAKEKGFFTKHGLDQVNLTREPSWKAIAQGLSENRLDAVQAVAGMPLALSLGIGGKPPLAVVSALTLSRNGNAITLSRRFYDEGVRTLADFKNAIDRTPDVVHTLGMVHPSSMHNLILRHWLASGGIDPDRDVNLVVIPPPQMVANLKAGNIEGYCVGEPWNSRAVYEKSGFVIACDRDIWQNHPEKVLAVREDWAEKYPQTHLALVKALLEACEFCDDPRNREEILEIICRPQYVGSDPIYTRPGFIDAYDRGTEAEPEVIPNYNKFYVSQTNCPERVEALWMMTQLARWDLTPFPRNWVSVIERIRRVDVYSEAARQLDLPGLEPGRRPIQFADGTVFNPDDPIQYLNDLKIKRDFRVEEIELNAVSPA
ncbi:MAG: nitrate ABC transporter ATP-binding protein [Jaaginema sp. PMC 1079.18]|nr:nitrate ABC transporter ATP-binding protein [Jaaginema sp. PMC 1080.18]MEC4852431.1 nitrate ABC transporter ATP-binding protein [Jaaginema sp. PMC 1079.18]MEC4867090.1 nitrate ABC transporter ATP-binding protein [Jaaginema sp. PMC 1078.18]